MRRLVSVLMIGCIATSLFSAAAFAQNRPNDPWRDGIVTMRTLPDGMIEVVEHSAADAADPAEIPDVPAFALGTAQDQALRNDIQSFINDPAGQ